MKLLILILILVLIYFKIFSLFEVPFRILHLVLYSKDKHYDNMQKLTNKYYKKFKNVDTYYYCYSPYIKGPYELKDNILYIKGDETYIPGILKKTIDAFEYFNSFSYNYVIRSNISTIIRFDLLIPELKNKNIKYGCALPLSLNGINYSSGTSIILSPDTVNLIVKNRNKLDYSLIDDVSIGKYMKEENIYMTNINKFHFITEFPTEEIFNKDIIFFRNRISENREIDTNNMSKIIDILI